MKETYKVKTPKRIVFGDPKYFEQFSGAKLRKRIVDFKPPKQFAARIVLFEEEHPDGTTRTMLLYLAPKDRLETYMKEMLYEGQENKVRQIGMESGRFYFQVDRNEDTIQTEGGCWCGYEEIFHKENGRRVLDAAIIAVAMPASGTTEDMRQRLRYFFKNVEQTANVEATGGGAS